MSKQRAVQLVEAAVWLEATGDLTGARKLYEQALKLDPENTRAQQALERDEARAAPRAGPPTPAAPMKAVPAPPPPPPAPVKATPVPAPKPTPLPKATPLPPLPPEPKKTLIQYETRDTLPPVDPDQEEGATVLDMSMQHLVQPEEPARKQVPEFPTLPGFVRPDLEEAPKKKLVQYADAPEPKTPPVPPPPPEPAQAAAPRPFPAPQPAPAPAAPAPAAQRRYLDVDWSALGPLDASTAPTPPWIPKEALYEGLDPPPAPPPEPRTPAPRPQPPIPPNMNRRKPAKAPAEPTPPPRNAWEEDGTVPGVDLSPVLTPPRSRDAMDLLSDAPPRATPPPIKKPQNVRQEVESLIKGARDLLELDDHSGAMDLIEKAAELAPEDPMVQRLKQSSEVVLQSMYESKLGPLDVRPRLLLRPDEVIWLNLDHRAGFVLAQIDGSVTYEDLMAICGMSRLDTLRILAQLVGAGVIAPVYG